ncbi:MAG: hypothetical protein K5853_03835 [Lachnospiraceae bacterium]|nr:hypothetical protein [Lachnospiraceae bacterium]
MGKDFMAYAEEYNRVLNAGEGLYQQLLSLREDDTDYLICPEHIGDSIWICALATDYKNTHDCKQVYIVGKDSQLEILERFPDVDGTVSVTAEEMLCLRSYIYYTECYQANHIVFAHFHSRILLNNRGYYAVNLAQEWVFGTMADSRKKILDIDMSYSVAPRRMRLFDDGADAELTQMFSNAIFFLPTMQTQEGYIPDEIFDALVEAYTKKGYTCYTNYNDFPYERMIKNTTPLASSLKELSVIAPYFKQVISVRSGACDLIAQTDANLSVLYHPTDVADASDVRATPEQIGWMSIFGLVKRERMAEYVYAAEREEEFIDALMEQADWD